MLASEFVKPGETIDDVIVRYFRDHDAEPVYLYLEGKVLTEENTDIVIDFIKNRVKSWRVFKIPFLLDGLCGLLDRLLPDHLLGAIKDVMVKRGLVSERRLHPSNPFKA